MDPVVSEHTLLAPGMTYASMLKETPIQIFLNLPPPPPPPPVHFSSLHLPLSHPSSASHSSPPAFFAAAHLSSVHVPLVHSSSLAQSSPPAFFSLHLPPTHELLVQSLSFSQSSPEPFLLLQPGKSGGHSAPAISPHCLGGSCPGSDGGGPLMVALTGTV